MRQHLAGDERAGVAARGERQVGARRERLDRAGGDDAPLVEQHKRIRQRVHLLQRVGDVEDRHARRVAQPREEGQHLRAARRIEGGERLVHQQQARAGQQRAPECHALALAAGQPRGAAGEECREAEQRHHLLEARPLHARLGHRARRAAQAVAQVGLHAEMREQPAVLEHHGAAAALGRHEDAARGVEHRRLAGQRHAPLARPQQPGDGGEHAALAAARGAEQRRHAGRARGEGDVEREARAEAVPQGDLQPHPRPSQPCIRRARSSAKSSPPTASANEIAASRAAAASPPGVCVAP